MPSLIEASVVRTAAPHAAPPVAEKPKEEQEPATHHQTRENVGSPATDRPRTGKKDALGEFLHTWTL